MATADRTREVLWQCGRGDISPEIALIRLLHHCPDPADLEAGLARLSAEHGERPELQGGVRRVRAVLAAHPQAASTILELLRRDPGDRPAGDALAYWRTWFDAAVRESPEASVALYSLGDRALLERVTAEAVGLLERLGVLSRERAVLEIGCGIGRFVQALAPRVATVVGIDIAPAMIEAARQRCAGLPNVRLLTTSGRDLAGFDPGSFDLVLAIDVMPYLYRSALGLVETHVLEAARVLRPGGDLVVLNLSYRGEPELDRRDASRLARLAGLELLRNGSADLRLWDGRTFHLQRPR